MHCVPFRLGNAECFEHGAAGAFDVKGEGIRRQQRFRDHAVVLQGVCEKGDQKCNRAESENHNVFYAAPERKRLEAPISGKGKFRKLPESKDQTAMKQRDQKNPDCKSHDLSGFQSHAFKAAGSRENIQHMRIEVVVVTVIKPCIQQ